MLEEAHSDVLLLYDCCYSAATTISPSISGYKGVTEVISACGYETMAPPVCEHSFSKALTQILASASQGQPFSVGELHVRVLNRLMCWTPSLVQDQDRKFIKDLDGRLIYERQPRRTPIYTIICETESRQSITLAPLKRPISISESSNISNDAGDSIAIPAKRLDRQQSPAAKRKRSTEEGLNTSCDLKQQRSNEKEVEYPQVLLAIRLESDTFDKAAWLEWLRVAPPECKDVKIEGRYDSFSALLLVRMPAAIWNLLPENAAYSFVGFVTSENKICKLDHFEIPTRSSQTNTEKPSLYELQRKCEEGESCNSPSWCPTQLAGSYSEEKDSTTASQAVIASSIYSHCILNPDLDEMRVLELLPDLSASSPINVRLSKAFVAHPPKYQALSYVWGDSSEKVPILVDGKVFQIRKNLFAALKRLRPRNSSLLLWIDAICIDQENVRERNFQIQLMNQIYSHAEQVIIWLGDSEDDSDLAMDLIKTWAPPDAEKMSMARLLEAVMLTRNGFDIRSWHAVRHLFAREYWKRVWILQEIFFSNQATVICGSKRVSWRELGIVQMKWEELQSEPENFYLLEEEQFKMVQLAFFSAALETISLYSLTLRKVDLPRSLFRLLSTTSASHATDPRDKIYALLGFEEVSVLDLEPDYTKSVERVYTEFVQAYLESKYKLDILFQGGIGYGNVEPFIGLPSWVPDFRRPVNNLHCDQFHAAEGTLAITTISKDLQQLTAPGIIYDVITDVDYSRINEQSPIRTRWLDLALNHKIKHPTGIPQLQAFFRTIIADDSGFGYGKPGFRDKKSQRSFFNLAAGMMFQLGAMALETDQSAFEARISSQVASILLEEADYIQRFFVWHQQIPASMSRQALLAPFLGDRESGQDSQIQWPEEHDDKTRGSTGAHLFISKEKFTCTNRCFFFTAKGYMGIGCQGIQKGDVVCILLGCDMPLVIRKIEEYYVLVGNAYIYGLMNGEALKDIQESKAKLEDIIFH
jgi:hypothetical protein